MAPSRLTCLMGKGVEIPPGYVRVPSITDVQDETSVRITDEAGECTVAALARVDKGQHSGAFLISDMTASALGVDEGFDYLIEAIKPSPVYLKRAVIRYNGPIPLPKMDVASVYRIQNDLNGMGLMIAEPGHNLPIANSKHFSFTKDVIPNDTDPPWIIDQRTQLVLEDASGPADVLIALDGPLAMQKTDFPADDTQGQQKIPRWVSITSSLAKSAAEEVLRNRPERIAILILSEKMASIHFSENEMVTPWLRCAGKNPTDIERVINQTVASRLDRKFTPGRNLADCIKEIISFALSERASHQAALPYILLFTDGYYTEGPNPVAALKEFSKTGVPFVLQIIGIGNDVDDRLLKRCAQLGHGTYSRVRTREELKSTGKKLLSVFIYLIREGTSGE